MHVCSCVHGILHQVIRPRRTSEGVLSSAERLGDTVRTLTARSPAANALPPRQGGEVRRPRRYVRLIAKHAS